MTAMSTHLYARIESKVKSSKRIVDMSVLSEEELNEELEKGYADVQAGRTKNAKQLSTIFVRIIVEHIKNSKQSFIFRLTVFFL